MERTYRWINCTGRIDVIGKGAHEQDAFSKLNPANRARVTFADRCEEVRGADADNYKHNQTLTRGG